MSNARLGMIAFLVFESMLFAGLLGGFVAYRWGSEAWPPAGQPYLPIAMTMLNTIVLLASCLPLAAAARGHRAGKPRLLAGGLLLTSTMGGVFLAVQGFEWVRMIQHGLAIERGVYGASFVLLIGVHALHVLGAVTWLVLLAILSAFGRIGVRTKAVGLRSLVRTGSLEGTPPDVRAARGATALDLARIYWYFVCAVWIAILALVYIA